VWRACRAARIRFQEPARTQEPASQTRTSGLPRLLQRLSRARGFGPAPSMTKAVLPALRRRLDAAWQMLGPDGSTFVSLPTALKVTASGGTAGGYAPP
jgi:hypothetical protein